MFPTRPASRLIVALTTLSLAVGCGPMTAEESEDPADAEELQHLDALSLLPVADIDSSKVIGFPDRLKLFANVDDGASFSLSDGYRSIVRAADGASQAYHTVGYASGPAGAVAAITVHFRAHNGGGRATAQVELYQGTTRIALGQPLTLTGSWQNYSQKLGGLNLSSANGLRTRLVLRNALTSGAPRYSQIWLALEAGSSVPAPTPVDAGTPTTDAGVQPPPTDPVDAGTTDPGPVTPPPASASFLPYSADSFFKSRVDGAAVPIDSARTNSFHAFMKSHPEQAGTPYPKLNMNPDWAMSYHVAKATDPIWRLAGGNTSDSRLKILTTQGFHMADSVADTFPSGTQDRPGVMIDPVFGYTVQFADAVPNKATRTISVSNAGIMWHSSNGLDYRNPKSNDERNFTSRGRILDSMVVRRDVLDRAVAAGTGLGHTLHLFFVETNTADGVCHPMVGAEGSKAGFGAEGERIRLKPSVDLKARGLTGAALAIAKTLQEHGAYLGDNSGSSTQIKLSQPQFYVGTGLTIDSLKGKITWDDFEVVQKGWQ